MLPQTALLLLKRACSARPELWPGESHADVLQVRVRVAKLDRVCCETGKIARYPALKHQAHQFGL
jgi:hypothetical protein